MGNFIVKSCIIGNWVFYYTCFQSETYVDRLRTPVKIEIIIGYTEVQKMELSNTTEQTKILIVDDNPEIREIVRILLESEGYEIYEAGDGTLAWRSLPRSPSTLSFWIS